MEKQLTVREAFALAGHPIPDGARIIAHFLLLPGGTAADVNRYWTWRLITDVGHFLDGRWQIEKINESDPKDMVRVISAVSINLTNLPAQDCIDSLPECVKEAIVRKESNDQ